MCSASTPPGAKPPPVDVGALGRKQMHRYRVARKRVHRDQVEIPRLARGQFAFQLHARVAQYNFGLRLRIAQEGKPGPRDPLHIGIDFIEAKRVARTSPRRERARAQADHRDPPIGFVERVQRHRDAAVRPVVGGRPVFSRGLQILNAVPRAAVLQLAKSPVVVLRAPSRAGCRRNYGRWPPRLVCRPVTVAASAVNPPINNAISGSRTAKLRLVH